MLLLRNECARAPLAPYPSLLTRPARLHLPALPCAEWGEDKKNFKAAAEDWANDWDDEDVDTDFDKVLRAELEAAKAAAAAGGGGGGGGGGGAGSSAAAAGGGK